VRDKNCFVFVVLWTYYKAVMHYCIVVTFKPERVTLKSELELNVTSEVTKTKS